MITTKLSSLNGSAFLKNDLVLFYVFGLKIDEKYRRILDWQLDYYLSFDEKVKKIHQLLKAEDIIVAGSDIKFSEKINSLFNIHEIIT